MSPKALESDENQATCQQIANSLSLVRIQAGKGKIDERTGKVVSVKASLALWLGLDPNSSAVSAVMEALAPLEPKGYKRLIWSGSAKVAGGIVIGVIGLLMAARACSFSSPCVVDSAGWLGVGIAMVVVGCGLVLIGVMDFVHYDWAMRGGPWCLPPFRPMIGDSV